MSAPTDQLVRHFRHILLWPLQLEGAAGGEPPRKPWRALDDARWPHAWQRVDDALGDDSHTCQERHYKEFVSFLPFVQRFLYGDARCATDAPGATLGAAPMRVFRRSDIAALRIRLRPDDPPITFCVEQLGLSFFLDVDLILLKVELSASDLPLSVVEEFLYRFGRAYPSGWDDAGQGLHNAYSAEWLDADGAVLATGDSRNRSRYLDYVRQNRAPCVGAHWQWLLYPLVPAHDREDGPLRYRQIEYHRMPFMSYLALERPRALQHEDFVRLGLISYMRPGDPLPQRDPAVAEFEARYCDDRYWTNTDAGPNSRFLCTGHGLLVIGEAHCPFFRDAERGMLAQFRHQYFLLFLIAHFHRGALLIFSNHLSAATAALDIRSADSVRRFKRRIRALFALFLGFTHRFWFGEISERGQVQALFKRASHHLGNDALYQQVKEEVADMHAYLDSDATRRQANTVVRLTVVTILGLIGTITTGFLGMNLIAAAEEPLWYRLGYFGWVLVAATALTLFAVAKSKRLSDFLEDLSDESLSFGQKARALWLAVRRNTP